MTRRWNRAAAVATALLIAPGIAACGKASDSGGSADSSGGIKTGPGVTADSIRLLQLTDLSGTFAPVATALTQAQDLYWKQQNAKGGVCGRKVELVDKDAGYDVQKAVSLYRDAEPDIAAVSQIVGSPIISALLPSIEKDSMLTVTAAWPPDLLDAKQIAIVGATYDVEAINGIEWLMQHKGLKRGDKIGDLYFEGDFGEGGLVGVKHIAKEKGLDVVEQRIKATDEDMSSAVAAFKRAGVKAIWVTTGPGQLASLAGLEASSGLNVPIGTNGPTFAPQLLKTPAGPALEKLVTVFNGSETYTSDNPEAQSVAAAYERAYPKGVPQQAVIYGWSEAVVMQRVLERACTNKDLSREGLVTAFRQLNAVDTKGLVGGTLDFTKVGAAASTTVFALDVDGSVKGGLKKTGGQLSYPSAQSYVRGH